MVKAKKIIYAKKFEGEPNLSNFRFEEDELPDILDQEILCEAEFLSIDPYMRVTVSRLLINSIMIGQQVAKVLETKNSRFPVGSYILGDFGWRTHTIVKPATVLSERDQLPGSGSIYQLADFGNLPRSLAIGYLGMPGHSAYFGLLEICKPQSGETVVVTAAAGAVGSLVGQIAKIHGCKVVGFAGSDEKCDWIKKDLGFDYAFNYKNVDIAKCLKEAAPEGVDCYFDNVGGEISATIINHMRRGGRISVCGCISSYNGIDAQRTSISQMDFIYKELKMEGFMLHRWIERFTESIAQISEWIRQGKVKCRDTVTTGFENMPVAFIEMLRGKNLGKAIIEM